MADDGSIWEPGKTRMRIPIKRAMGDQFCGQCPKWTPRGVLELSSEDRDRVRIAMLCLRLKCLPDELLSMPWSTIEPFVELWESPMLLRTVK